MNKIERYPGIPPFSAEQKEVFFGRKNDMERLYNLVLTERMVLMHAKSGLGKSSLINAGLMPLLSENSDAQITSYRFSAFVEGVSLSPVENMVNTFKSSTAEEHVGRSAVADADRCSSDIAAVAGGDVEKHPTASAIADLSACFSTSALDKIIPNENSLWYHYKSRTLQSESKTTFYLIFDQFEELFSYPPETIFTFKKQLADLLFAAMPKNFEMVLHKKQKQNSADLPDERTLKQIGSPLDVHVLFAIRADRMSEINQLHDFLPSVLRTLYQLNPLTVDQLREAITEPAAKQGDFISRPFGFENQTVNQIIDYLTKNHTQPAETTQLQIVCQNLEKLALAKEYAAAASEGLAQSQPFTVTPADLPDFKNVILQFYYDTLHLLPIDIQALASRFVEDELIKKEQRISLDKLACSDFVKQEHLEILERNHLLRAERNSTGGISYELSHDTMVAPILEARKVRVEREKAEEELRVKSEELRVKKEKEDKERLERERQIRQQRLIITIVSVAAVISIAFGLFGLSMYFKANAEKQKAQTALEQVIIEKENTEKALEAVNNEKVTKILKLVDLNVKLAQLDIAKQLLDSCRKINCKDSALQRKLKQFENQFNK